ncbi:penicillin-binding protein 2 [Thermaerobacter litoralis]
MTANQVKGGGGRRPRWPLAFRASCLLLVLALAGCSRAPGPDAILRQYLDAWEQQDYAGMYAFLDAASREAIAEQDFIDRYRRIEEGIERTGLTARVNLPDDFRPEGEEVTLAFDVRWQTALAGEFSQSYTARLVREEEGWRLHWTPALIFPDLQEGDKVRAQSLPARRGSLVDRQGRPLALDEPARAIGLVPGKMAPDSAERLAQVLSVPPAAVEKQLAQPWVRDDLFVPIVTWPESRAEAAEEELLAIPGVLISSSRETARWYPHGALAAHTLGYIGAITAEELTAERREAGYGPADAIGKQGLERVLEAELRGRRGGRIWIERADGSAGPEIVRREPEAGRDVRLSLDLDVQRALEESLDAILGDSRWAGGNGRLDGQAAAVVLDPSSGEVMALASRPAFDPNRLADGITAGEWQQLTGDSRAPLFHKALAPLPPGSTFKPFTAAVALEAGVATPDTDFGPSPDAWQKDPSWGDYYVRRVPHPPGRVDLIRALVWSDNVYFARLGLALGEERFLQGLARFGLGAEFPFDLPVGAGQVAGEGGIRSEIQLADSAYGQGEVQVSPLQLAAMYTAFVRDGTMARPRLVLNPLPPGGAQGDEPAAGSGPAGGEGPAAISPATAGILRDALRRVVSDPTGTAHALDGVRGWTVAGKTGTAQVSGGEAGARWRWFAGWAAPAGGGEPRYVLVIAVHQVGAAEEGTPNPAVAVAARLLESLAPGR